MLEANSLTKRYNGVVALDSLTLTVAPGDVFCLLGANGAGKTTTINLFLNFIQPTSGAALVNGLDVTKAPLETINVFSADSVFISSNMLRRASGSRPCVGSSQMSKSGSLMSDVATANRASMPLEKP